METIKAYLEIPELRAVVVLGLGWFAAVPAGLIHKALDQAPDWVVPPQATTAIAAAVLAVLGYAIASLVGLPREYGAIIGGIGGTGSGTASRALGSQPVSRIKDESVDG